VLSAEEGTEDVRLTVESALAELDAPVPCIARSADEIRAVVAHNPLADVAEDPSKHLVFFLSADPPADAVAELLAADHGHDVLAIEGREAFVYASQGVKQLRLPYTAVEKALGVVATARNWATVGKLVDAL
jgi:uncharacterized protein (DUF1697 family)